MHKSVLLQKSIDELDIKEGDVFLDATLGNAGHTLEVFKRFGNTVTYVGLDQDRDAIARALENTQKVGCQLKVLEGNFKNLKDLILESEIPRLDKIIFDAGISSEQIEISQRGFTFLKDEPLVMTLKKEPTEEDLTAYDVVNLWSEDTLREIIRGFGEERFFRKIANAICEARKDKPIKTTFELRDIIVSAVPKSYEKGRIDPATRTFQAIRIAVNEELRSIEKGLKEAFEILSQGGRISFISFHSLEDRIVKRTFRQYSKEGKAILINKKPIIPDEEEVRENRRARSAKLRVIEKI